MDPLLCPEVVGRDAELRELFAAVDAAARGRASGNVLLADAGVGKSRLVAEVRSRARERGVAVLHGRVLEGPTTTPFRPFAEAVAGLFRSTPPADPALRTWLSGAAAPPSALALAEAVLRLLAATARERGALLVVEDLHWADSDTVAVVEYLLANAVEHGAACVLTLRPDGEAHRVVRRLADTRAARLLELAPLPDADVERMVLSCLRADAAPAGLLRFVRERADGVPFFVEELLAGLLRTGALVRVDDGWRVVERRLQATVPPTVAESVAARFGALHPRTQRVLHAAALLGRRFDWRLLPAVTGLDEDAVLASLREAGYAQFLESEGAQVRFRHALTREHIAVLLLAPERAAVAARAHRVVTHAHPGLPGDWCTLAAELAELAGDRTGAAAHLAEAGRRARDRGMVAGAAAHLERALDLLDPAADDTLDVREDLAAVRALAGDVDAALALGVPALDDRRGRGDSADRERALHLALGWALLRAGRYAEAAQRVRGASGPAATVLVAHIDVAAGDPERAEERAREVLATPDARAQDRCEAWLVTGQAARLRDVTAAEHAFSAALAVADEHGLAAWRARALHELGTVDLFDSMRTDRLEQARRAAVETGAAATVALVDFHLAEALVARGRTADGRAAALRAIAPARRLGSSILAPALITLARSHAHELDIAAMEDALARAHAAAPGDGGVAAGEWGRVRAMLALHQGDPAAALAALDRAVGLLHALPGHHFPHWGLWALLHALDDGDPHGTCACEAAGAAGQDTRFNRALLRAAHAVRIGARDPLGAQEAFAAAVAELRGYVDADWLVHLTGWLVAPAALRDGWGEPVALLQGAVRWFADHDHPQLATRCRTLLRDAGGQVPRRGRGIAAVPAELLGRGVSSREVDVLRLLGRHLTNRGIADALVLSPRTVEKHVASLLRKTGAADRGALAALAAALPPPLNG